MADPAGLSEIKEELATQLNAFFKGKKCRLKMRTSKESTLRGLDLGICQNKQMQANLLQARQQKNDHVRVKMLLHGRFLYAIGLMLFSMRSISSCVNPKWA
jgi:hypothetical protein